MIVFSILLGTCYSQSQLKSLLNQSDSANVQLRNIGIQKLINKEEKKSYLSARFPQINYSADYKYNAKIPGQVVPAAFFGGQPGTYATVQFGVPYVLSNNFQISQILFNSQLNYGLAALKINQEITDIQEQMTKQEVHFQIASNYYIYQSLLLQETNIDSILFITKNLKENVHQLVEQNLKIPLDEKQIDLTLSELEMTKKTINENLKIIKDFLTVLVGYESPDQINIMYDQSIYNSVLSNAKVENYYSVDLLKSQLRMAKEEKKGLKMAYLPSLNAYGIYNYSYNLKPDDNFRKGIDGAFIGLRADWNLFDGLQKKNKYQMVNLKEQQLNNNLEFENKFIQNSKIEAKMKIQMANEKVQLAQSRIDLSDEVYKNSLKKYKQNIVGSTELLLTMNELIKSRNNQIEALLDLRLKEINYLKLIGDLNF